MRNLAHTKWLYEPALHCKGNAPFSCSNAAHGSYRIFFNIFVQEIGRLKNFVSFLSKLPLSNEENYLVNQWNSSGHPLMSFYITAFPNQTDSIFEMGTCLCHAYRHIDMCKYTFSFSQNHDTHLLALFLNFKHKL